LNGCIAVLSYVILSELTATVNF